MRTAWWDLMCVSTRERNQFPSVLLAVELGDHPATIQIGDAPQTIVNGRMARAADGRNVAPAAGTPGEAPSTSITLTTHASRVATPPAKLQ
jgi:hypothetical protein